MVSFALSFAFGVWFLQQMEALPTLPFYWPLALLCLLLPRTLPPLLRHALLLCCAALLGFCHAAFIAQTHLADSLPDEWQGRNISLTGVVAEMPRVHERGLRFAFDVETTETDGATVPHRILLSTYRTADQPAIDIHAGERWRFTVRLKRPHSTRNPHTSDFEAWALERNIRATGYVYNKIAPQRLDATVFRPAYLIEKFRETLRERFHETLPDAPYAGILVALAIGDQASISQDEWRLFTRTGVNHLMSISGLHITMLAGMFFGLTYWLWRRNTRLTLRLPARKAAALAGVTVALAYSLISGFEIPAQRTFYMLSTFAGMLLMSRNVAPSQMLAAALLVVLSLDPWAVLAPGFWLSFGAVALIFYVSANRLGRPHWLVEYGKVQWAMSIGLIPPLLALFQQLSLVSPLANAFAIPLVSLLVVPLTLLGALPGFSWTLHIAHHVLAFCMTLLRLLDDLPVSVWVQHAPPAWSIASGALGALWILAPRGFPLRAFGVILLLPMFLIRPATPAHDSARIRVFDVGQGLAVAVQTQHHALLFDTGPDYAGDADSGNRILVPALRGSGVDSLDTLILSHGDIDHIGGTDSLLQAIPTDLILTSMDADDSRLAGKPNTRSCRDGMQWDWDGVNFEVLHPPATATAKRHDNEQSCVLRISVGERHILLTADIETASEARLLQLHPDKLPADLLVAPHHGSRSSSSPAFVAAVDPQHVIFTAGYRNRFHHPHPEVIRRYMEQGSHILRSDRDGAITIDLDTSGIKLDAYRHSHRRYWSPVPEN
ncbi:MAG: DNA internalization-related competence protein ComEC/Rec2 [Gammaproteobacteria bacterium]|nr:DNA internalization-related competence protein ComEC/Rec2 [Sideroxydans sp.]MBU3902885.1 DNA internalization-related competence protein ComEC/Rec2 [Gammaproteobacteria bacterium]MBU4045995.1 DNA internalization-related competence protein ComEC/Rec2 [Gammaproteobacteria bacterium]MBU4150570.1 DNA internalization-related competence protein ComEC/Rec2 [Gammaproteobacteria bacterium]